MNENWTQEHFWLISYDIRDRKRLYYAERFCEDYAVRVQNSVYEMRGQEVHLKALKRLLDLYLDKDEDSLFILELCGQDLEKKERFGRIRTEEVVYEKTYQIL